MRVWTGLFIYLVTSVGSTSANQKAAVPGDIRGYMALSIATKLTPDDNVDEPTVVTRVEPLVVEARIKTS